MQRRRMPSAFCAYVVREPGGVVYGLSGEHDAVHGQSARGQRACPVHYNWEL
jgi:hypothetical protein